MIASLVNVISSARAYRAAIDQVFSVPLAEPEAAREYFFDLLLAVSQLYLDYLLVVRDQPAIEKAAAASDHRFERIRRDSHREMELRERFRKRLEVLPCWEYFEPFDAFANYTGLRTLADYIASFVIQLPEAYEESFRVERYAQSLLEGASGPIEELILSLQHMGLHHLTFVRYALEGAAKEGNWRIPDEAESPEPPT